MPLPNPHLPITLSPFNGRFLLTNAGVGGNVRGNRDGDGRGKCDTVSRYWRQYCINLIISFSDVLYCDQSYYMLDVGRERAWWPHRDICWHSQLEEKVRVKLMHRKSWTARQRWQISNLQNSVLTFSLSISIFCSNHIRCLALGVQQQSNTHSWLMLTQLVGGRWELDKFWDCSPTFPNIWFVETV